MAKASIMIVEDEALVVRDISARLTKMGYQVAGTASNGDDAIGMVARFCPDLILMDIKIKGPIDGITTAQVIQCDHDIPIIFCTAFTSDEILERAKLTAPYGYVLKPFDNRELEINIEFALFKHQTEKNLRISQQRLSSTLSHICEGVLAADEFGVVYLINPVACEFVGVDEFEAIGMQLDVLLHLRKYSNKEPILDIGQVIEKNPEFFEGERFLIRGATSENVPVEVNVKKIASEDGACGYVVTVRNITEQIGFEKRIRYDALYDGLTGLPNRALFLDRLNYVLNRSKREDGHLYAVLFIDLDEFRLVNEGLGHQVGDTLVTQLGKRIGQLLRPEDTLSRFSGDIFVILLDPVDSIQDVIVVCNRIQEAISQPVNVGDRNITISSTAGIVVESGKYQVPQDILRDADTAMHRAKSSAKGSYVVFDAEMHKSVLQFMEWRNGLQSAMKKSEFFLCYQPVVSLVSGEIVSFEALIRWRHPEYGLVSPADFIPIAEETGHILPMGEWVLRTVCNQVREWQGTVVSGIPVAVNLSAKQFESDIKSVITSVLDETSVPPSLLALEVTEGVAMKDIEKTIAALKSLRNLGLNISIDDFGTGYSSLAYLKKLPIHTLKIDRSFIMDIERNLDDLAITQAIIALAQKLRLKVLAEGVETRDQVQILTDAGCHYVQGYYFSQPVTAKDVPRLFAIDHTRERVVNQR